MDSELTRPSEVDESQSSKLSSVNPSDMNSVAGSDSDSSSDGVSEATPQVEWLATGRERRSTAGNRMKSMLANEEPDSDLELLFAEDENDQGFSDAGDNGSDVQMDSSSDEDDDNNNDDDLEGERELDRQAKERRAAQRKRKAQEAIPARFRKKVRIDTSVSTPASSVAASTPTTAAHQPPRPRKKSERSSWLPSPADMPTRASSRKTTRLSKEQLHAQMEEREAKRLKQLAQMQKKAARLEALKKPPMTQEDRLREAALVEERNSKSLNRWEEAEKQREEERRARLAALHERKLKGPVISFWSGMGRFGDGWRKGEGIHVAVEEKPKKARKEKPAKEKGKKKNEAKDAVKEEAAGEVIAADAQGASPAKLEATNGSQAAATSVPLSANASVKNGEVTADMAEASTEGNNTVATSKETPVTDKSDPQTKETPATAPNTDAAAKADATKDGVGDVVMTEAPTDTKESTTTAETKAQDITDKNQPETNPAETSSKESAEEKVAKEEAPEPANDKAAESNQAKTPPSASAETPQNWSGPTKRAVEQASSTDTATDPAHAAAAPDSAKATEGDGPKQVPSQPIENDSLATSKAVSQIQSEAATPQPDQNAEGRSPLDGLATARDAIIFQNFDENAIKDRSMQTQVIFGRKMNRLPKPTPAPMCLITNNPARYRDPKTELHFYSAAAFKELQRLQSGEYRWSKLLGAWAGSGTIAARGVPERFLNPARCPTLEEVQRMERKKEEKTKLKLQQAEDEKKFKAEAAAKTKDNKAAPNKQEGEAITEQKKTVGTVESVDNSSSKAATPAIAV